MKRISLIMMLIICTTSIYAQKNKGKSKSKTPAPVEVAQPTTPEEISSYALGANIGESLTKNAEDNSITLDWNWIKIGIEEALQGKNRYDEAMMAKAFGILDSLSKEGMKKKSVEQLEFLENNKKNPNIIVTASGLQYEVIKMGTGAKPKATDEVKVHYEGKTIDGKVFDSSYNRGEATTFPLNQVIKGWTEGMQLMPVGSKFKFYIPYDLAYGERGAGGGVIKPYATLIFEVELIEINPQKEEIPTMQGIKIK